MLVRDVLPLMEDKSVVVRDRCGYIWWCGRWKDGVDRSGVLTMHVLSIGFYPGLNEMVVVAECRDDGFHDMEQALSDCMRWVDEGRAMSFVNISHAARRIGHLAEVYLARFMGRGDA